MGAADLVTLRLASPVGSDEPFATMAGSAGREGNLAGLGARADLTVQAVEARYLALARAAFRGFNAAIVQQLRQARTGA